MTKYWKRPWSEDFVVLIDILHPFPVEAGQDESIEVQQDTEYRV